MGNILTSSKKYRIINNDTLLEMEPTEQRRQIVILGDEIKNTKTQFRMLEEKYTTDTYNLNERIRLIQKDLESLVINDKLLLDEIKKLHGKLNEASNSDLFLTT